MKKRIAALFAVIILLFTAVGCENVEYPSGESSQIESETSNIYEELANRLPDLYQEGETPIDRKFTIVSDEETVFSGDESNPGTISNAIVKRNKLLKEKYGAEVVSMTADYKTVADNLVAAKASGNSYCDMIALSASDTMRLYVDGLLCDLNSLPNFDAQSEYFDENNATALATNKTLYLLPDPSTFYYDEIYTMFFNRKLIEDNDCENPETLAAQGKWTWDKFKEIEKSVAHTVNGKPTANLHSDIFGFASYYGDLNPVVMWTSCGSKMIDDTYYNDVDFSLEFDEASTIGRYIYNVNNSKSRLPLQGDEAMKAFENGRLCFFTNKLEYINALRDGTTSGSHYGMVPMPKYNESQEGYNSLVSSDARVISVPKTVENGDEDYKKYVSTVVSAICAAGGKTSKSAFISQTTVNLLNNNIEASMLLMVVESATFDFSHVFSTRVPSIKYLTNDSICRYLEIGIDFYAALYDRVGDFRNYAAENFN